MVVSVVLFLVVEGGTAMFRWIRQLFGWAEASPSVPEPVFRAEDIYDQDIEYLIANPHRLGAAWGDPYGTRGGSLFMMLGNTNSIGCFGCPTMVKNCGFVAGSEAITQAIRLDQLIPSSVYDMTPTREVLERFAFYQRAADADPLIGPRKRLIREAANG